MYTSDKRVSTIIDSMSHECTILPKRFYNNFMVLHNDKSSFMFSGVDNSLQTTLACRGEILNNAKHEKVLGVTLDNKLDFATHLLNVTENANTNFNALTRFHKDMTTDQKKFIFFSFIKSQFTYCPLI